MTSLHVVAIGVSGSRGGSNGGTGGKGAVVTADIAVMPGQTLYIEVGGKGGTGPGTSGGAGGFSGGGASDVRTVSCGSPCNPLASGSLVSRLVVAAGGGRRRWLRFFGAVGNEGDAVQAGSTGSGSAAGGAGATRLASRRGSDDSLGASGAGGYGPSTGGGGSSCLVVNGTPQAPLFAVTLDATGTASVTLSYVPAASVTLTSSLNPSAVGQQVTLMATVTGSNGTPTGTVTFYSNGQSLGTGTLNGSGVATLTTSFAAAGAYGLVAVYSGDSFYPSSISQVVVQTVSGLQGPQGPSEPTGPQDPQGATAPQGLQGPAGRTQVYMVSGPTGPAGAQGATGPLGSPGPQGPPGPSGAQTLAKTQKVYGAPSGRLAPGGASVTATVSCPTGSVIVSGGYQIVLADPADAPALAGAYALYDEPDSSTTWMVTISPPPTGGSQPSGPAQVIAVALCAPAS